MDFKEHLTSIFGEDKAYSLLTSLRKEPTKSFRLTHKANGLDSFVSSLKKHPILNNAYYTNEKLGNTPYHHLGAIYIQDASAMLVANIIPIKDTDFVLDLCAAPGGKTTQAAERAKNGLVISNDISYNRAKILSQNVERLGLKNVFITNNNIDDFKHLEGFFDKIILDAPCSGEGMFRKNELAKLDWDYQKVLNCATIQKELILKAYKLLKKNGIMIYSTCTFSKEENEDVITYLLENTNATLLPIEQFKNISRGINMKESIRVLPDEFECEGHFMALIQCNDNHICSYKPKSYDHISNQAYTIIKEFLSENLRINIDKENIILKNDIYYLLPRNIDLHLKTIRIGLELGCIAKQRFIPSHALALAIEENEAKETYELSDEEIKKYLHGETITNSDLHGYILFTYKHMSIGFGKVSNGQIKNLYPKGLRI